MLKYICVLFFCFGLTTEALSQCYPDRHNTNWFDGWVSCEAYPNPNEKHGTSHWILYDLGQLYRLNETHIWNYNDPAHLGYGIRDVIIDYSGDGIAWTNAGTYTFDQATGKSIYEGSTGPDLGEIDAQFVLLTAIDNWGGSECFGLGEIRFSAQNLTVTSTAETEVESSCLSMEIYPNPFSDEGRVLVHVRCNGAVAYRVVDVLGRLMKRGTLSGQPGMHNLYLDGSDWPDGTYLVTLQQGQQKIYRQVMRME